MVTSISVLLCLINSAKFNIHITIMYDTEMLQILLFAAFLLKKSDKIDTWKMASKFRKTAL